VRGEPKRPVGSGPLTQEKEGELTRHLSTGGVFTAEEVEDLVWAIQHWMPVIRSPNRHELRENRYLHFSGMVTHARALQKALASERPLWGTKDISWENFEADLARLVESAEAEVQAASPRKTRGRRPEEWRDDLIALVRSRYPETFKRGLRAHFEYTIALLLKFIDAEPDDIKATVRDVLRRNPQPPFSFRRD
jgi:hypothetical protein